MSRVDDLQHGVHVTDLASCIGLLLRTRPGEETRVRNRLGALPRVETFPVDAPGAVGVWLEADGEREAHDRIERELRSVEGVLAAWPVFAYHGDATGVYDQPGGLAAEPSTQEKESEAASRPT